MRIATTTGDLLKYYPTAADAVAGFDGTGFRHLDYSFYTGSALLGDDWFDRVKEAKETADKLGFDFVQAHSPGNNFLSSDEDYEQVVLMNIRTIEACGYLGIKNTVLHSGFSRDYFYPQSQKEYFEINRRFYERLYPAMEKYDVNVLIENSTKANMGEYYFFMRGSEMVDFIEFCGHEKLGACWDVGHANIEPIDQYEDLIALGDKLKAVHIQDNLGAHDDHIAPYMGTLDIDGVMRGLIENGFVDRGGVFTFECDNILAQNGSWPNVRKNGGGRTPNANIVSADLKRKALGLLYDIGCKILSDHGIKAE